MKGDSRIQKSLLNAKVNTICFFASLIISFFSRKIFLDHLGTAFMGLSSTLGSLLGFLNIAELGIGAAIGCVLYKPIANTDENKIKDIVSVLGYLYRWIGHIILILGFLLSLVLPFIFEGESFSLCVIYIGFYAYLFSSLIGYYNNYRQVLLSADQRNYEVTGYYQIIISVITLMQMILALYTGNFYVYFLLQLIGGIIYSFVLNYRINRVYPWLKTDIKRGNVLLKQYPEISKMIKQIFVHRIAGFVQFELSPFLIYSFVSLPMVAIYSNYSIITEKLSKFVQAVLDSTTAGVGNLISEGNSEKIWDIYKQLFSVRLFVTGFFCSCFFYLVNGFVNLWVGDMYILSNSTVLLMTISLFLLLTRGTTDQFLNGYGMYSDIWAPIAEAIIFLVFSIVFGYYYGLNGILLGPIISMFIIVHMWKPFFLFRNGLKRSVMHYVKLLLHYMVLILLCYWACLKILSFAEFECNAWIQWLIVSIVFAVVYTFILFVLFYFTSQCFRIVVNTNLRLILKR